MHSTNYLPSSSTDTHVNVYESVRRERDDATTILGLLLLRGPMEGVVDAGRRRSRTRSTLKERLGLKGFGCCGATWGFRPTTIRVRDDDDDNYEGDHPLAPLPLPIPDEDEEVIGIDVGHDQAAPSGRVSDPRCLELGPTPIPVSSGMNLAAALAAERQFREDNSMRARATVNSNGVATEVSPTPEPGKPWRVSLMRLLEETDGGHRGLGTSDDKAGEEEDDGEKGDYDRVCCVCLEKKKGAAFIPCGHTFCRVCSREIWLNRGSCPLCNRSILDILDIF